MNLLNIRPGVKFHEVMTGSYKLHGNGDEQKKFWFDFQVEGLGLGGWLMDITLKAKGKVYCDGFADGTEGEGILDLRPNTKQKVTYDFYFKGNDGKKYHFIGTKTINFLHLIKSWTTLPGKFYDANGSEEKEIGEGIAYFNLKKDLPGLLASMRLLFVPGISKNGGAKEKQEKTDSILPKGRTKQIAVALAKAALPKGKVFPEAGESTLVKLFAFLGNAGKAGIMGYSFFLWLIEILPFFTEKKTFTSLTTEQQEQFLCDMQKGGFLSRLVARTLTTPMKIAHFNNPEIYHAMGCVFHRDSSKEETPRYMQQVKSAADLSDGEVIECDVVVVGTGAGGAVVAKELADRGLAVVMLEEGEYKTRNDFTHHFAEATRRFYRNSGGIMTVGNTVIPIPLGKLVGGSTAINTGTCFRTPEWVLEEWREKFGLTEFTPEHITPYFEKVERTLPVETAKAEYTGSIAKVIAGGCDKLGWHHFPLRRNAPECDGQGVCNFGCPTDAKRSMNVSYVPLALNKGALLFTGAKAERVHRTNGKAEGIIARSAATGKTFKVTARATILSCGTLLTPVFLQQQKICNSSRRVGKNLSIHPAISVAAMMNHEVKGYNSIPQGYGVDQFHREGILFLGASAPMDVGSAEFPFIGKKLIDMMEAYDRVAQFGCMIEDHTRGVVRRGLGGQPFIWYWVGKEEMARLKTAVTIMARIYFAAGAQTVFTGVERFEELNSEKDIETFAKLKLTPRDFIITAFHPLGTCAMGPDPKTSVVNPNHETHDVKNLYICDGSVVPTPLCVNPQETIMALSTRAAERIAGALEG